MNRKRGGVGGIAMASARAGRTQHLLEGLAALAIAVVATIALLVAFSMRTDGSLEEALCTADRAELLREGDAAAGLQLRVHLFVDRQSPDAAGAAPAGSGDWSLGDRAEASVLLAADACPVGGAPDDPAKDASTPASSSAAARACAELLGVPMRGQERFLCHVRWHGEGGEDEGVGATEEGTSRSAAAGAPVVRLDGAAAPWTGRSLAAFAALYCVLCVPLCWIVGATLVLDAMGVHLPFMRAYTCEMPAAARGSTARSSYP